MAESVSVVRVAAVGDLHCSKNSQGQIRPLFENSERFADILVLCGDLTDYGLPEEARLLVERRSRAFLFASSSLFGGVLLAIASFVLLVFWWTVQRRSVDQLNALSKQIAALQAQKA